MGVRCSTSSPICAGVSLFHLSHSNECEMVLSIGTRHKGSHRVTSTRELPVKNLSLPTRPQPPQQERMQRPTPKFDDQEAKD